MTPSEHSVEAPKFEVTVDRIADAAEGVLHLWLSPSDGTETPAWEPGGHVDLILPNAIERQYSLIG